MYLFIKFVVWTPFQNHYGRARTLAVPATQLKFDMKRLTERGEPAVPIIE